MQTDRFHRTIAPHLHATAPLLGTRSVTPTSRSVLLQDTLPGVVYGDDAADAASIVLASGKEHLLHADGAHRASDDETYQYKLDVTAVDGKVTLQAAVWLKGRLIALVSQPASAEWAVLPEAEPAAHAWVVQQIEQRIR